MITKEQKHTLKMLENIFKLFEEKTKNKIELYIGEFRYIYWDGKDWIKIDSDLSILTNNGNVYKAVSYIDEDTFDIIDDKTSTLKIDKNIIINLNTIFKNARW